MARSKYFSVTKLSLFSLCAINCLVHAIKHLFHRAIVNSFSEQDVFNEIKLCQIYK